MRRIRGEWRNGAAPSTDLRKERGRVKRARAAFRRLKETVLARSLAIALAVCVSACAGISVCQDEAHSGEGQRADEPARDPAQQESGESKADLTEEAGGDEVGVEPELIDPETGELALDRLLDWLDDLYRADSSIAQMTRTLTMKAWTLGTEKALLVVEAPARDKGTATLKVGKNLWNYLPRIARTIRIPPSMMMSSWMGSDFTNDDLVRESSLLDDYEARVVGRSDDPEGWLIDLKAKEGTVGLWDRVEYVVSPDGRLPLQARYYDRKGRLARTMTFSDVREFDGRRVPARLELVPTDKEDRKTVLVYDELEFNVELPESMFSLSQLERHR
jgi:outer membrane lipoprotein-sorting protein